MLSLPRGVEKMPLVFEKLENKGGPRETIASTNFVDLSEEGKEGCHLG